MAAINRVFLLGNLTRDPVVRHLPSGTPVAELGMAVNRKFRDSATGEMREDTCFVDVSTFGKQATVAGQYLKKGLPVFVEGRLRYERWENGKGEKRSRVSVVADRFQFVPGGKRDDRSAREEGK